MAEQDGPTNFRPGPDYGNLASFACTSISWMDERGLHIAFFDLEVWQQIVTPDTLVTDILKHARLVLSMNPCQAQGFSRVLARRVTEAMDCGMTWHQEWADPAPYEPDTSRRIHEAWVGTQGGEQPQPRMGRIWDEIDHIINKEPDASSDA